MLRVNNLLDGDSALGMLMELSVMKSPAGFMFI
jgi:hypothetical protein